MDCRRSHTASPQPVPLNGELVIEAHATILIEGLGPILIEGLGPILIEGLLGPILIEA
jgi:hypothetical protein